MPILRRYRWDRWANHFYERFQADAPSIVAVDTETSGVAFTDRAFCVTLSWRDLAGDMRSAYIDTDDEGDEGRTAPERRKLVASMLDDCHLWVFHNAKFDLQKLDLDGMLPSMLPVEWHDTQTIFNLLDENSRKGLKPLAERILGETTDEEKKLAAVRRKLKLTKDDGYHLLPRRWVIPYAMRDTEFTLRLYENLWPRLQAEAERDPKIMDVYDEERQVSEVLRRWEANGLRLDLHYLQATLDEYSIRVMQGWTEISQLAEVDDPKFPNSPKQISEAFAKRGFELEDTTEATLKGLDDDLARALLQYRSDKKMHTTYLKNLMDEQENGIIHPWFNPTGARTGRMSSGSAVA
jgi:DNA polymerase I-like protein with 3'-5' exonuclease and polymerase domains